MPSVWWPWACQLLFVGLAPNSIVLDLVSLEPCRLRDTTVGAGVLIAVRMSMNVQHRRRDVLRLARWAEAGETVTMMAGRDGRAAWLYLRRRREGILVTEAATEVQLGRIGVAQ